MEYAHNITQHNTSIYIYTSKTNNNVRINIVHD